MTGQARVVGILVHSLQAVQKGASGEDPAKQVDHQRQPIALVPSDWQQKTVETLLGVIGRSAAFVGGPVQWDLLTIFYGQQQLSCRRSKCQYEQVRC